MPCRGVRRLRLRLPSRDRPRLRARLRRGRRGTRRGRRRGDRARRRSRARRPRCRGRGRRRRRPDDGPWLCRDPSRGRADHRRVGRRHGSSGFRGLGRLRGLGRRRGRRGEPAGRVVGRRHRRTAGGPCSRRTGERGQAGAHREQIASEPQDDVHLDTYVPPSEPHGTSVDARVSIRARVAAGRGGHPASHAPSASCASASPLGPLATRRLRAGPPASPALRPGAGRSRGPSAPASGSGRAG